MMNAEVVELHLNLSINFETRSIGDFSYGQFERNFVSRCASSGTKAATAILMHELRPQGHQS